MPKYTSTINAKDIHRAMTGLEKSVNFFQATSFIQRKGALDKIIFEFIKCFCGVENFNFGELGGLIESAAAIFTDHREQLETSSLQTRMLKLAALFFPYSPSSFNLLPTPALDQIYDIFSGNFKNKENSYAAFFLFFNELMNEKTVDSIKKFTYLCSLIRFFIRKQQQTINLHCIIRLLEIFNFPQIKKIYKVSVSSIDLYEPNYYILLDQKEEFWNEIKVDSVFARKIQEKNKETSRKILEEDENFFRKNNIVNFFDLFKKELQDFIEIIDKMEVSGFDKLERSRKLYKSLMPFMDKEHVFHELLYIPLREKIDSIEKKVENLRASLLKEEESTAKIEQAKKYKKKLKKIKANERKKILQIEKKKEVCALKNKEAQAKELSKLQQIIVKFDTSLIRLTDYMEEVPKIRRKFNAFNEKISSRISNIFSDLEVVCKSINLALPRENKNNLSFILNDIDQEVKNSCSEDSYLKEKLNNIKTTTLRLERNKAKLVQEIECLFEEFKELEKKGLPILKLLDTENKLTKKEIKALNKHKVSIENLSLQLDLCEIKCSNYDKFIGTTDNSLKEKFFQISSSITSLKKMFQIVIKNTQHQFSSIFDYSAYEIWKRGFKENFYETLEAIHRLPGITIPQGRKEFDNIFRKKLDAYSCKLKTERDKLLALKYESRKDIESELLEKEIKDLEKQIQRVDNAISLFYFYSTNSEELYHITRKSLTQFTELLNSFEKALQTCKHSGKGDSQSTTEKLGTMETTKSEDETYDRLDEIDSCIRKFFIAEQQPTYTGLCFFAIPIPESDNGGRLDICANFTPNPSVVTQEEDFPGDAFTGLSFQRG